MFSIKFIKDKAFNTNKEVNGFEPTYKDKDGNIKQKTEIEILRELVECFIMSDSMKIYPIRYSKIEFDEENNAIITYKMNGNNRESVSEMWNIEQLVGIQFRTLACNHVQQALNDSFLINQSPV